MQSQPATTEPQEGPQGQAGDQSLAAGLNPSEDSEVQVLGEVNGSKAHPSGGLGAIPPPAGVPIIKTPPVFQTVANPSTLGHGNPGVAQKRQYVEAPHYDRGFKQRVYGRNRGGGYGGRKNTRSFPRGPRGGGNANYGAPGIATNSFRGNGGHNQGGYGGAPEFTVVNCWSCHQGNPSQNQVCSYCYSRLY